jgi:hypothetical protein
MDLRFSTPPGQSRVGDEEEEDDSFRLEAVPLPCFASGLQWTGPAEELAARCLGLGPPFSPRAYDSSLSLTSKHVQ